MDIRPASRFAIQHDRASAHTPSPIRSPHKRHTSTTRASDPLLSHLSPTIVSEALEASDISDQSSHDSFYTSIAAAAPSERALAIRAVLASRDLQIWQEELQQWKWPSSHNGFEPFDRQDPGYDPEQDLDNALTKEALLEYIADGTGFAHECWGSLPASTVLDHEKRIEGIRDSMDALELNEMKAHIRELHLFSTSGRPSNAGSRGHDAQSMHYSPMDDLTAIVTTIIMQALPAVFRVQALLGVWDVRLAVLRAVPRFTNTMSQTQEEMVAAWRALEPSRKTYNGRHDEFVSRPYILGIKAKLESQIRDLGQRLDFMLDTLEGRPDTIPDAWLDDMEKLEVEFGDWVVESEKVVADWELRSRDDSFEPHQRAVENLSITRSSIVLDIRDGDQAAAEVDLRAGYSTAVTTGTQTLDGSTSLPDLISDHTMADVRAVTEGDLPLPSTSIAQEPLYHFTDIPSASQEDTNPQLPASQPRQAGMPELSLPNGETHEKPVDLPLNSHRPSPLNLQHSRNHSNALSDFSADSSYPGSATSDYFSDMSSPEIHDASKKEYFGVGSPVEVTTPSLPRRESRASEETVTRQSSQRTERGDHPLSVIASPSRSRASTIIQEPTISEYPDSATVNAKSHRRSLPNFAFGNTIPDRDTQICAALDSPEPTPPIPTKSKHRFEEFTDLSPGNTPVKVNRRKTADLMNGPTTPQVKAGWKSIASPTKSTADELEARISSILTDIPANIRLARGSGPSPGRISQSPASRAAKLVKKSAAPRLTRSYTAVPSPPAMTLTPADQISAPRQNGESEIKVYHLHQSGKEAPIKLFVRLVGEGGERVMVRIGGGWADLAEYLKEYATHHGRRAVSDGRFDIQGLPHSQSSSPVPTLGSLTNTQTSKSRPHSPITGRSASGAALRSRRFSTGITGFPSTPVDVMNSPDGVRPNSRDSNASSRHSWLGDDSPSLGLAGPKSRNAIVSPNKQAWVDTMMEKARSGSSEKKKGTKTGFGDLGIMGGTKRLFMKREKES